MPLILVSTGWVAGIFLGSKFSLPVTLALTGLGPLLFLPLLRQHKKRLIIASLCLVAVFLGAQRFESSLPARDGSSLQIYHGQTIEARGIVEADPDISGRYMQVRLSAREVQQGNEKREVSGTVLLFSPSYSDCRYGDEIIVRGKLEAPPQLGDFDYPGYLAQEGVYSLIRFPEIEIVGHDQGSPVMSWIYSVRNGLSRTLASVLPEPQASLAQGMVLGIRGNIPDWLNTEMSRTGTTHILAISGLNISIVAGILLSLGIWLFGRRRYVYVWLALAAIWLYALLTGMSPPVIRGTIMASLFFFAEILGRQRGGLTSLAFAAAVMVGITPMVLWSASFQMSFLAMFGLITVAPALQSLGRKAVAQLGENKPFVPVAGFVTDSIAISLGAIIAVWPVIAYYFGLFSFASPLATLLILAVLAAIIITGALAGLVGLFFMPLAQFIAWLAWLFTSYMLLVVRGFASFPSWMSTEPGKINPVIGYYLALGAAIWFIKDRRKLGQGLAPVVERARSGIDWSAELAMKLPVKWVIPPLAVLAILASVTAAAMPDSNLHVSFLDVGEGDAILIQTPARQNILIDGGPDPARLVQALGEKMPFWDRTIDLVVLTHPHQDHLYGLMEVLQRYQVKQVLAADITSDSSLYGEWLRLIREKGISYNVSRSGQQIGSLGPGIGMEVLTTASPAGDTDSDIDANSTVLRLEAGHISFLFTADIAPETEWDLLARRAELDSTVLKVAHHGSKYSTTAEFLTVASPNVAVISTGAGNRFGHPAADTLARLRDTVGPNLYRTDEHGTIELITDGEKLWIKTSLNSDYPLR